MAIKTQVISSSRAGLGSVIVVDGTAKKTQVVSNVGVIAFLSGLIWIVHPFP